MKYNPRTLGKKILDCREEKGFTQAALGEELANRIKDDPEAKKYDRTTISRWESGNTSPRVNELLALCDIFECDFGYLIGEPGYENKTRAATDMAKETDLTGEAAYILQKYKKSASKREPYTASKFLYPDEFIPVL